MRHHSIHQSSSWSSATKNKQITIKPPFPPPEPTFFWVARVVPHLDPVHLAAVGFFFGAVLQRDPQQEEGIFFFSVVMSERWADVDETMSESRRGVFGRELV